MNERLGEELAEILQKLEVSGLRAEIYLSVECFVPPMWGAYPFAADLVNGSVGLYISPHEVAAYLSGPLAYVAKRWGVTIPEYLAWCEAGGVVRCSRQIKGKRRRCKNVVVEYLSAAEWSRAEVEGRYCRCHGGEH